MDLKILLITNHSNNGLMKRVGIIGGSGFIGSYITRQFLKKGYEVKVSVTNIKKTEKFRHLFNLKNSDNLNISGMKVEDKRICRIL